MLRFFKSIPRMYIWDHERKGDTLVEINLSIEKTDGFGFSQTESLKDFHGLPLQASIYTSIDAVRHSYLSRFSHAPSTPVVALMNDDSRQYSWYMGVQWLARDSSPFGPLVTEGRLSLHRTNPRWPLF